VIVRAVVLGVFVVVYMGITTVRVLMDVLVRMVMCVRMGVLVGVFHVTVGMLMCVRVGCSCPCTCSCSCFPSIITPPFIGASIADGKLQNL